MFQVHGNSNFVNGRVIYTWTDQSGGLNPKTSGTIASFKFKAKITEFLINNIYMGITINYQLDYSEY